MAWVLLYSPLPCGYLERKVGDAPSFFSFYCQKPPWGGWQMPRLSQREVKHMAQGTG